MSNEQLGIVAEAMARRQTYGRFAYRPPVITNPQSVEEKSSRPLLAKISGLEAEIGMLKEKNADLERRIAILRNQIDRTGIVPDFIPMRGVPIEDVQADFLERLRREDYRVEGAPFSDQLLLAYRRTRGFVIARHVCIWLARRICVQASLTKLGKAFHIDHTSAMHAIKRAPFWMNESPLFARLARETLEAFGHTEKPQ